MPGTITAIDQALSRAPPGVKDAYATWLSQLDGDDAADKVLETLQPRRRHRSRAERAAQVEHAQQSTAASSLKRSAVAVAVDSGCTSGVYQENRNAVRLPAIEVDKDASLHRRRQALVGQASYAALNSYSPDLAPGLAFLVRLVDAAASGASPFRPAPAAGNDLDTTHATDSARIRDYELPNFPVRIVPTLLRVRSNSQGRSQRSKEPLRERRWTIALLLCRDPSEPDDESSLPSATQGAAGASRAPAPYSKPVNRGSSGLTLLVRLYLPPPQPERRHSDSLSSETRRSLVRMLLSSWVSTSGAGCYGGGVRAVYKHGELASGGGVSRPSSTAPRLLRSAREVEQAVDTLCDNRTATQDASSLASDARDDENTCSTKRLVCKANNNASNACDASHDERCDSIDAVQCYIPSRSSLHTSSKSFNVSGSAFAPERSAWIARCSFRKKEKNPSTVWILSGGGQVLDSATGDEPAVALTVDEQADSCQIVKCNSSQSWTEPRLLTATLAPELERILRVSFKELVVDFVQGPDGGWLLLQVKAFELRQQARAPGRTADEDATSSRRTKSAPDRLTAAIAQSAQRYRKWRCAGRYCSSSSSPKQLSPVPEDSNTEASGYLSLKVVRSCEFVDDYYCRRDAILSGGFDSFTVVLAFHLQHELPKREVRQLYESQPLCSACMRRYYQLREQLDHTIAHESKADAAVGSRGGRKPSTLTRATRRVASTGTLNPARPRVLPALQADSSLTTGAPTIYASTSAPDLMPSPKQRVKHLPRQSDQGQRSYLDELAAMEKLLATPRTNDGDPEAQTMESRSEGWTRPSPGGNHAASDVYARIFSPEGQRRRVEAMWQSVAPKSLALGTVQQPRETQDNQETYNTFSIASELRRRDEHRVQPSATHSEYSTLTDIANATTTTSQATAPATSTVRDGQKTHHIRLSSCRSVFSDDEYRERIVQEAVDAIVDRGERVCFIVMPAQSEETEDPQLPDIALRSLHLDVKDGLVRSDASITMAATPQILHEASGCITMMI